KAAKHNDQSLHEIAGVNPLKIKNNIVQKGQCESGDSQDNTADTSYTKSRNYKYFCSYEAYAYNENNDFPIGCQSVNIQRSKIEHSGNERGKNWEPNAW